MPIIPITKEFVGVTDIMKIFRCSYFKAKIMLKDAKKYDTEGARCIENQVPLEKLLLSLGIQNTNFWLRQQILRRDLENGQNSGE